ncbi:MAG TPA: hypothetical protein PKD49_09805 [Hyphomicrobium sp.]|nr:hypothetical protein [Hyphomicrobium sp.]
MRKKSPTFIQSGVGCSTSNAIVRRSELQRLLPLWPHELADLSLSGRQRILRFLARALREERRRCRAGHWTYDVARHAALARHLKWERVELERLERFHAGRTGAQEIVGPPPNSTAP